MAAVAAKDGLPSGGSIPLKRKKEGLHPCHELRVVALGCMESASIARHGVSKRSGSIVPQCESEKKLYRDCMDQQYEIVKEERRKSRRGIL